MMRVHAHSLVGNASPQVWSQAQTLTDGGRTVSLILLMIKSDEESAIDLPSIGGSIFDKCQDNLNEKKELGEWKSWLSSELQELERMDISSSAILANLESDYLWMWGEGKVESILRRDGKLVNLVGEGKFDLGVGGQVKSGDLVILATKEAAGIATQELKNNSDADNWRENLAPLIHNHEDSAKMAMITWEIEEDEATQEVETNNQAKWPQIKIKRLGEPKKINMVVGVGLMAALMVLVGVGVIARSRKIANEKYQDAIGRSQSMVAEAQQAAGTNPERAKILLGQGKETLSNYLATKPKAEYARQAEAQLAKIDVSESEILKVRGISLNPTVELKVLDQDLKANKFETDGAGSIYFWDGNKRQFVGINLSDLSKVEYSVDQERYIGPFSVTDGTYYAVSSEGIWRGDKEQKIIIPKDDTWGEIGQITTFGNNVYLLDRGNGEIWKYAATDQGYGERRRWFGKGIVLDLSKVSDWVVDGDIWLLTSSGKLERYSRGVPVAFELAGFPSESATGGFDNPVALSVVDEKIYILERGAERVVALDSSGNYLEQYKSIEFANATDLAVWGGKGYVLIDNVVKEWNL